MSSRTDHTVRRLAAFLQTQAQAQADAASVVVTTEAGNISGNALAAHVAESDPHTQYLTQAEGDARYALGPALTDPTTNEGDLIYRGAVALTRLGIGGAEQFLRVVGGVPAWVALTWAMIGGTPTTFSGYGISMATSRLIGRTSPSSGTPEEITVSTDFSLSSATLFLASALSANARVAVRVGGTLVGTRRAINLIAGSNVTITPADDAANERVDITIASTGGGGGGGAASATGTYASLPAAGTAGRLYLPTDAPFILRDTGSAWQPFLYPSGDRLTLPPTSGWSWVNQGDASIATAAGMLVLAGPTNASSNIRLYVRTPPTPPYTVTALLRLPQYRLSGFGAFGICFRQSSNGRTSAWAIDQNNAANANRIAQDNWTTPNTFSTGTVELFQWTEFVWLRISDDGTNHIFSVRDTTGEWSVRRTVSRTTWLTAAADEIGLYMRPSAAAYTLRGALLHWEVT